MVMPAASPPAASRVSRVAQALRPCSHHGQDGHGTVGVAPPPCVRLLRAVQRHG